MKTKCTFRVGTMQEVSAQLKSIEKHPNVDKGKINLDMTAFNLLNSLFKGEATKIVALGVSKLNKLL